MGGGGKGGMGGWEATGVPPPFPHSSFLSKGTINLTLLMLTLVLALALELPLVMVMQPRGYEAPQSAREPWVQGGNELGEGEE